MLDATRPLFETDPGGGGALPAPDLAPAPEAPAPEPADAGGGEQEWSLQREDFEQLQEVVRGLEPLANLAREGFSEPQPGFGYGQEQYGQNGGQQQGLPPPPDPAIDPDGFGRWMQMRDEQLVEQISGRFQPFVEDVSTNRASAMIEQAVGALPGEMRDLGLGDEHAQLAEKAIVDMSAAFYDPQRPLPEVMQESAQQLNELLAIAKARGRDEYIASLQGGGGGEGPANEPGVGGGALEGVPQPRSYDEIIARHMPGAA